MSDIIGEKRLSGQVPRFLSCGDTALCIEFGDSVDRRVSALVLALAHRVEAASVPGVVEMVPTFRSLLIHYDPLVLPQRELKAKLAPLLSNIEPAEGSDRQWRIPACYDRSLAPDLAEVAARIGMTPEQVVQRHSGATYHVYMVGFLPGYPYMGDLPPELALPRRENPRTKVPPGSVAIATTMTAVYPLESPGGWHLIGRTPVPLWDLRRDPPAILDAGDQVIFEPISLADYEALQARVAAGSFSLEPAKPSQRGARR
jgi:KipI family sensor histidine kinase inhibitor